MNNKYLILSASMLLSAGLSGCHEDNGNYSYIDLDKVTIIQPEGGTGDQYGDYSVDLGDNLKIDPKVLFNGKEVITDTDAPLSYMWTIYPANAGIGVINFTDTLATTRVLDVALTQAGGNYYVQLTVTNNKTGIEAYFRTTCKINATMTAGWLCLYEPSENPGMTDFGLVINPLSKKGITHNKQYWNLAITAEGKPFEGKPVSIHHHVMPIQSNGMTKVATEKELISCAAADCGIVYKTGDLFYSGQVEGPVQFWSPTLRANNDSEALIANNKVMTKNSATFGNSKLYFGVPKISDEDLGELAPWLSCSLGNMESVFYSQTNSAFYYTIMNNANIYSFATQDLTACQFDVNNLNGARMLFADWASGMAPMQHYDYFLFAEGDKRYVAEANFTATGSLPNLGLTYADVSNSPDIKNATAFAVNSTGRYVFYGAGNKVYTCAYENGNSENVWTSPDANEVVTCIRTHKFYSGQMHQLFMNNAGRVIHIATWNDATKTGKLYEYFINPASGKILTDGEHYEYVVPGKVKDMCWKFQMGG